MQDILYLLVNTKWCPHCLYLSCDFMHQPTLNAVRCKYIKYACSLSHHLPVPTVRVGCWLSFDWQRAREPESPLHLGQAALALKPWVPPFLPPCLPAAAAARAAAAATHVAVNNFPNSFHTYVSSDKHASTHDTQECYQQRKLKHTHTCTQSKYAGVNFPKP